MTFQNFTTLFQCFAIALVWYFCIRRALKTVKEQAAKIVEQGDIITKLNEEIAELRSDASGDDNECRSCWSGAALPIACADAEMAIFIIDRVPTPEDRINSDTVVMWFHPRLQQSWRWLEASERWEENTTIGRNGLNHMATFLGSDTFVSMCAHRQSGCAQRLVELLDMMDGRNGTEVTSDMIAVVQQFDIEIAEAMDRQAGNEQWTALFNQNGTRPPRRRPAFQPGVGNPFEDRPRATRFTDDDDPS